MHWSDRHRYAAAWAQHIYIEYLRKYKAKPKQAEAKCYIEITSLRTRMLDKDNLIGGCKGLVDSLKKLEMIVDDSPKWVEVKYDQIVVSKGKQQTVIEIFEEDKNDR